MASDKSFLYDWGGANEWLFTEINSIGGDWYHRAMIVISRVADNHNVAYIIGLLLICTFAEYSSRHFGKRGGARTSLILWFGVFCVLSASLIVDGLVLAILKNHFGYPRPYIVLGLENVTVLEARVDSTDDYRSFPSGHASRIALIVASIWPILPTIMKKFGVVLIFLVCWSRIALGMHFPSDVLAGVILSWFIVTMLRYIIYKYLRKWFGVKC